VYLGGLDHRVKIWGDGDVWLFWNIGWIWVCRKNLGITKTSNTMIMPKIEKSRAEVRD